MNATRDARCLGHSDTDFVNLHEYPTPRLERSWQELLTRVECPSHYICPEYFLVPHWAGKRPFAILARSQDRITGVLTGLHSGGEVSCGLASRPQVCVDATRDVSETLDALARGLLAETGSESLISVFTWESLPLAAFERLGFRCKVLAGNVVLDLTKGAGPLFAQFSKDRRRNIRFAEKNGVEVSLAVSKEDVEAAFEVHKAWRRTERKVVTGETATFEMFEKATQLQNRRMFLARVDGKPIAINVFRFFPGGLFESASNCSLDEFLHLKPNELLQWRGIQWACAQGLQRHSLGGAHQFLRRFGGAVVPILRYRLDRTWLRRHELRETVLDLSRGTMQKMPLGLEKTVRRVLGR
jgi:Acetyltransferase (GNAT) domain